MVEHQARHSSAWHYDPRGTVISQVGPSDAVPALPEASRSSYRAIEVTEQPAGGNGCLQILAFSRVLSLWRAAAHESSYSLSPEEAYRGGTCDVAQVRMINDVVPSSQNLVEHVKSGHCHVEGRAS
jgi:hypothetical protein